MKKIIILLLLNCCCLTFLSGQFEVIGSKEYGRIFDVTYDKITQNKLYATTVNHILSSNDNGQSWDIFYSVPEYLMVGTGKSPILKVYGDNKLSYTLRSNSESGRTIYMLDTSTKNITHTYTAPSDPDANENSNWIEFYSISESDPDYALVAVGYMGGFDTWERVYYTKDGGELWTEVYYSVNNFGIRTSEVAIHPENLEKLYLTLGYGPTDTIGGLLISDDGGQTWQESLQGINLKPIEFNPANPNEVWVGTMVGAPLERLYKSTDAGGNWTEISLPWTDYLQNTINKIVFNPLNPLHMIALEENEVAISYDGGNQWNLYVYDAINAENYNFGTSASFNPFNQNEVFVSTGNYPMFSMDKGETLQRVKTKYFISDGYMNYFNNGIEEHLYYGVQFGFSHRNMQTLEENGYEIIPVNFVPNDSGTSIIIDQNIEARVYIFSGGFMGSELNVSNNHGEIQHQIHSIFSNSLHDVKSFPDQPDKIWASFSSFGDNPELYKIDFSDLENVQANSLTLPNSSGVIIGFHFGNDENTAIAAKGSRVHKTTDGGASWTEISNGLSTLHADNDMIFKLVENPLNENQISIASNKGIYTSKDGGNNWTLINTAFAHNVKHSTISDGHIIASTHDSDASEFGLKYSKDDGETWTNIADEELKGLISSAIFSSTDFNFYDEFVDVFISTSGLGVIKFTIDLNTMKVVDSNLLAKSSTVIYPNPTTNIVNIQSKESVSSAEIIGLSGQKLINSSSKQINVSHLNKGVYILKVFFKNGKTETHKLIRK